MHVYVPVHVCTCACGGQRLMLVSSLPATPSFFLILDRVSMNLELTDWPASPGIVSACPVLGARACTPSPPPPRELCLPHTHPVPVLELLGFLCTCWGSELRSSRLCGKHFTRAPRLWLSTRKAGHVAQR